MLLINATLVNWQPREISSNRALLIRDGLIQEIGPSSELVEQYPQEEMRDCRGCYVLPANICAHTHFYGAYARGMNIPGRPARDFPEILRRLWWPLDKALTAESIRHSALVCLVDAIKHGTTTLFDHHASPNAIDGSLDIISGAIQKAGLRAVLCYEVTDRDGPEKAEAGIAENMRFIKATKPEGQIGAVFGLHASMTLNDGTLAACAAAAINDGFHIHVAEHEADEEDSQQRYQMPVVTRLKEQGILGENSMVAHAIHIDPWELETLRLTQTWVTHQPRSNMNNGVGAMRFDPMMRGEMKVCIGNDGFSNDMWAEWKAAYFLHKVVNRDPRKANGADVAQAGAVNNAKLAENFLKIKIGTLAPGFAADLMVLDYHPFTPLTADNLPWHAIFGFESSMCIATICAGKVLMWDRVLLTLDEAAIATDALAHAPEVWARYNEEVRRVGQRD